jgi:hypothetical protein
MVSAMARRDAGSPVIEETLSKDELRARADREAKEVLGVSSAEVAFEMLDRGELRGTLAEAEFAMFRYLLQR